MAGVDSISIIDESKRETVLVYLKNTYLFEYESKVLDIGENEKGKFIVLYETIFHPQGGGQPSDTGKIEIDKQIFNVTFVGNVNGVVYHYVNAESLDKDLINKLAKLSIDHEKRFNHAKSHTSGHLLSCIVEQLAPELKGVKGHHFLDGPYVEFKGKLTSLSNDDLIQKATQMTQDLIVKQAIVSVNELISEENNNKNKIIRTVRIDGFEAIPCGGTHLNCISELKQVSIKKIQFSKGNTKISYLFV